MLGGHLAKFDTAGFCQAYHLHPAIGVRGPPIKMTGFDQALDQPGHIAVRHHHALRDVRQRHALRRLVELGHQVEARQRDVKALAQPAAHLALDQGRTRQQPQPQSELIAMLVREFDGLGLGIKDHDAIVSGFGNLLAICPGPISRLADFSRRATSAFDNGSPVG